MNEGYQGAGSFGTLCETACVDVKQAVVRHPISAASDKRLSQWLQNE
jgi:hypothetical protein